MNFNSHAREGRDVYGLYELPKDVNFNSHAREGRDHLMQMTREQSQLFQLTRPWRAWQYRNWGGDWLMDFNSHAREGRDGLHIWVMLLLLISTHTPVKGVTLFAAILSLFSLISTHTPVKGVTRGEIYSVLIPLPISTHTPVKGVTILWFR